MAGTTPEKSYRRGKGPCRGPDRGTPGQDDRWSVRGSLGHGPTAGPRSVRPPASFLFGRPQTEATARAPEWLLSSSPNPGDPGRSVRTCAVNVHAEPSAFSNEEP